MTPLAFYLTLAGSVLLVCIAVLYARRQHVARVHAEKERDLAVQMLTDEPVTWDWPERTA